MRVCITGSDGMLGFDLSKRLKRKYEVIDIDIDDFDIVHDNFADFLLKNKPDFLFHLAAYTNVDKAEEEKRKAYEVNVLGTRNIVTACRVLDIPLVFISTDYVFDGEKELNREEDEPNPLIEYGWTKLRGEQAVQESGVNHCIIRTSLYGWNLRVGKLSFQERALDSLEKSEEFYAPDDQFYNPILVNILAEALFEIYVCGSSVPSDRFRRWRAILFQLPASRELARLPGRSESALGSVPSHT